MGHIHITLVGGQPTPVYQGIIFTEPDEVLLICSKETFEVSERIKSEISVSCRIKIFEPVDFSKILIKTNELAKELEDNKVTVNISGGTKPWSLAFFSVFQHREDTDVYYIDQNAVAWNITTGEQNVVQFDMDAQFRLYGNALNSYKKLEDYRDEDKEALQVIKRLRNSNPKDFNELTTKLSKKNHLTEHKLPNGSELLWNKEERFLKITLCNNGSKYTEILRSPNIRNLLLNTGWFEYEVALMLSKWEKAKEIRLNCMFPAKNNAPKNEADIIVDTGSKLLFVECKTQIHEITDIDKFRSVVKNYGGMGSKALFVTDTPMTIQALEKCEDNGILSFSIKNIMMGQEPSEMLNLLLNTALDKINPR